MNTHLSCEPWISPQIKQRLKEKHEAFRLKYWATLSTVNCTVTKMLNWNSKDKVEDELMNRNTRQALKKVRTENLSPLNWIHSSLVSTPLRQMCQSAEILGMTLAFTSPLTDNQLSALDFHNAVAHFPQWCEYYSSQCQGNKRNGEEVTPSIPSSSLTINPSCSTVPPVSLTCSLFRNRHGSPA